MNIKEILAITSLLAGSHTALAGWNGMPQVPGIGYEGQGAGMALINLDANPRPELVLMAYDNPSGENYFGYKIGWNLDATGQATFWSNPVPVQGVGAEAQGAGVAFTNLDSNPRPEIVLMAYDNPTGANTFRYRIGWNVDATGQTGLWTPGPEIPGVGFEAQGAGIAFTNLDGDARPEMVLMAYDNPPGGNYFSYKIGWNLDASGWTAAWSNPVAIGGVGFEGQGAGLALTNMDTDARPEMVLMAYDNPEGGNTFRYQVGWNVDATGKATSWTNPVEIGGVGFEGQGADVALYDLDGNGRTEMLLMAYDNPAGANSFRYLVGSDIFLGALGFSEYKSPTQIPSSWETQTAPNLYQLSDPVVLQTAYEAAQDYVNDCHANPAAHASEVSNPATITLNEVLTRPDAMVAAVAWFVNVNMRWTPDSENEWNLNKIYKLNYSPGWDFPIPANYTILYTDSSYFTTPARFHGDCEDHAILRAALLRSLGFNPAYVWNVMDDPLSHEYNVVMYRGALRIMDYGPIGTWLPTHNWDSHRSYYGYSESYGRRDVYPQQHDDLVNYGNNYPAGAAACRPWDYHNYYQDTCP